VCFVHPKSANGVLIELCQSMNKGWFYDIYVVENFLLLIFYFWLFLLHLRLF
jgi:hypothetical protein